MELSAFTVVDSFPPEIPTDRDRLREVLLLGDVCETSGLSRLWVAEHHFHPGGLCPNPPLVLAAIGQRTQRLRLGVMVSVLPFHDPVELAEQYALLDRLLLGRLDLGVGSGYIPLEFEGFGIDPADKRARFDKALETLLLAFRGEPVRVDRPTSLPVRLNVRPLQLPHPPIWIAAQRPEALPFIARRGFSVALIPYATVGGLDELGHQIAEFRRHAGNGARSIVSAAVHLYAGPQPDRARGALQRYLDARLATQSTHYQAKVDRDARQASADAIERSGLAIFGSAAEVTEQLERFRAVGVDELLGIFDFGGLSAADVRESVQTVGRAFGPSRRA